jgi:hypothetical protein
MPALEYTGKKKHRIANASGVFVRVATDLIVPVYSETLRRA